MRLHTEHSRPRLRHWVIVAFVICALWPATAVYGDPASLNEAVAQLQDTDPLVRSRAAGYLMNLAVQHDRRAVAPLVAAMASPDSSVRVIAASGLGLFDDPRAVDALVAALSDPNDGVRGNAINGLGLTRSRRAVGPLIAALASPDSGTRGSAASGLGMIKDPRAIEPLLAALSHETTAARSWMAQALGEFNDPRAVDPLLTALNDPDWTVKKNVAMALAKLKTPRLVNRMLDEIKEPNDGSRANAALVLNYINDARATGALTAASNDTVVVAAAYERFIKQGKPGSEAKLIEALQRFGDKEMAEDYLNCGNKALAAAASRWATGHGLHVATGAAKSAPVWGDGR
jgi:HEAT repeat protein